MVCPNCKDTKWVPLHAEVKQPCSHCCKHAKGWWELTHEYYGYVEDGDNRCCIAGCGVMARDLEET